MIPRIACALLMSCAISVTAAPKPKKARNVILLLADAGGIPTINAASIYAYNAPQKLFIQSWPYIGLSDTSPRRVGGERLRSGHDSNRDRAEDV